jgi:chromosome segregation ATPase
MLLVIGSGIAAEYRYLTGFGSLVLDEPLLLAHSEGTVVQGLQDSKHPIDSIDDGIVGNGVSESTTGQYLQKPEVYSEYSELVMDALQRNDCEDASVINSADISASAADVDALTNTNTTLNIDATAADSDIETLKAQIISLIDELAGKDEAIREINPQADLARRGLEASLRSLEEGLRESESRGRMAVVEADSWRSRAQSGASELELSLCRLSGLEQEVAAVRSSLLAREEELDALSCELEEATLDRCASTSANIKLKAELGRLQESLLLQSEESLS